MYLCAPKKPVCASYRLLEVSPTLPLKQLQCSSLSVKQKLHYLVAATGIVVAVVSVVNVFTVNPSNSTMLTVQRNCLNGIGEQKKGLTSRKSSGSKHLTNSPARERSSPRTYHTNDKLPPCNKRRDIKIIHACHFQPSFVAVSIGVLFFIQIHNYGNY